MKTCSKCNVTREITEFPVRPNGSSRPQCKVCRAEYMREYYARPGVGAMHRARVQANRPSSEERKAKIYGMTVDEVQTMHESNNGLCWICNDRPATCIDHSHATGFVRGYLCSPCNTGLGMFKENTIWLREAIKYLGNVKSSDSPVWDRAKKNTSSSDKLDTSD